MHPNEPPVQTPKARPGLLVEDRNAAVRTHQDGSQEIVKVPSRPAEADRQGVSEARI
jgi:hypothetical protein